MGFHNHINTLSRLGVSTSLGDSYVGRNEQEEYFHDRFRKSIIG